MSFTVNFIQARFQKLGKFKENFCENTFEFTVCFIYHTHTGARATHASRNCMLLSRGTASVRVLLVVALSVLAAAAFTIPARRASSAGERLTTMHNDGHDALHAALDPVVSGVQTFMESNHHSLEPAVTAHDVEEQVEESIKEQVEEMEQGALDAVQDLKHFEEETHDAFEPEVPASEFGHQLEEQILS